MLADALAPLELSIVRFRVYRHFARLFAQPEAALFESIRAEAAVISEGIREAFAASGSAGADPSAAAATLRDALAAASFESFAREHARVFGPIIGKDCPPYETQFGSSLVFQQAQRLADVSGFYRAFGLKPSSAAAERLDHLSLELEFMAFLAARDLATGPSAEREEEAARVRSSAAADFLREHLLPWVPHFVDRLSQRAGRGVLGAAGTALVAFLLADARLRGVDPESVDRFDLLPPSAEPEGSCFECAVGGGASAETNLRDVPM